VLQSDECAWPECAGRQAGLPKERRVPCLKCFGKTSYCSEDCMDSDFHAHNFECGCELRKVIRGGINIAHMRRQQVGSQSFANLLKHVIKNVDRKTLLDNIFFVRLPFDVTEKIQTTHAVKTLARAGCAAKLSKNICLLETWKRWIKHVKYTRDSDQPPHLYFFAYPPDFSFVFMTAVPYDEQEHFDESLLPFADMIACPCTLHSPTSV